MTPYSIFWFHLTFLFLSSIFDFPLLFIYFPFFSFVSESFSNWFEEKVNLPIFDEIPTILPTDEFNKERSYEGFGYPQLTPPQSPPGKALTPTYEETSGFILPDENVQITFAPVPVYAAGILQTQNVVVQPTYITLLPPDNVPEPQRKMTVDESYLTAPPTPIPDIEKEMAVLDEVVRDTAENLAPNWDQFESESFHSDVSSESFACSSPRSESASATSAEDEAEEETDDPEWQPEETVSRPRKALKTTSKRSKPYSRSANVEDKRLRKKEQNKNAATRYRMKKKAEVSEILEEEKQLEDKNAELEKRVGDITTEIKYLKGLMRELFKAKGLIE